jgi:hypothetical protein
VAAPKRKEGEAGKKTTPDDAGQHVQGKCGEANEGIPGGASLLAVNQDESRANGKADLENSRLQGNRLIKHQAIYHTLTPPIK